MASGKTLPVTRFYVNVGLVPKADERSQITEPGLTLLLIPCTSVSVCKIFTTPEREKGERLREGGKMSVTNCMLGKQIQAGENEGGMGAMGGT